MITNKYENKTNTKYEILGTKIGSSLNRITSRNTLMVKNMNKYNTKNKTLTLDESPKIVEKKLDNDLRMSVKKSSLEYIGN